MTTTTFKLDGRKFHGITQHLTASQDDYILAHLRLAGVLEVMTDLDGKKRTKQQRAEDLLTQILLSGRTHQVLAGCLTEEGKTWNRTDADANATKFAAITDPEEKNTMRSSIVEFVIGFFTSGEPSSPTSRRSSSLSAKVPPTKNAAQRTTATSQE